MSADTSSMTRAELIRYILVKSDRPLTGGQILDQIRIHRPDMLDTKSKREYARSAIFGLVRRGELTKIKLAEPVPLTDSPTNSKTYYAFTAKH